ncbi:MAG: hypothetical protein K8T10_14425 [Candidatus Eremiobacteraeota bacterium]|nr:hypothetical protein [Candidatus Eremiobacteraeota bacterium]
MNCFLALLLEKEAIMKVAGFFILPRYFPLVILSILSPSRPSGTGSIGGILNIAV